MSSTSGYPKYLPVRREGQPAPAPATPLGQEKRDHQPIVALNTRPIDNTAESEAHGKVSAESAMSATHGDVGGEYEERDGDEFECEPLAISIDGTA